MIRRVGLFLFVFISFSSVWANSNDSEFERLFPREGLEARIQAEFEAGGSEAVLLYMQELVEADLVRRADVKGEIRLVGHPNEKDAIEFLSSEFERMGMATKISFVSDASKRDPYLPNERIRAYNSAKWARYLAGPGVIALGIATGQTAMVAPVVVTAGVQTAYEIQFATPWIDRNFWTPIFKTTGKLRKVFLGLNPGILAVNFLYPASLYECARGLCEYFNISPEKVVSSVERAEVYPLFGVGAVLFSLAYGRFQDDAITQRAQGRISEATRYLKTTAMNLAANGLRVMSIFIPITVASLPMFGTEFKIDLGTAGLLGLGVVVTLPQALKTAYGPTFRSLYIRERLKSNESGEGSFKLTCLSGLNKIANAIKLKRI